MRKAQFTNPVSFVNYIGLLENHGQLSRASNAVQSEIAWLQGLDNGPSDKQPAAGYLAIGEPEDGFQASFEDQNFRSRFTDRTVAENGNITVRHYELERYEPAGWEVIRFPNGEFRGCEVLNYEDRPPKKFALSTERSAYVEMSARKAQTLFTQHEATLRHLRTQRLPAPESSSPAPISSDPAPSDPLRQLTKKARSFLKSWSLNAKE